MFAASAFILSALVPVYTVQAPQGAKNFPTSGVSVLIPGRENQAISKGVSNLPKWNDMNPMDVLASLDHEEATMYELSENDAVSLGFSFLEDAGTTGNKLYIIQEYAKYTLIQDDAYPALFHKYGVAIRMVLSASSDDKRVKVTFAGLFKVADAKKSKFSVKCKYEAIGFGGPALTKAFPMPTIVKDLDGLHAENDNFGKVCRTLYDICTEDGSGFAPGSWLKPQPIGVIDTAPPKKDPKIKQ